MKLSTVLAIASGAMVSSRTLSMPADEGGPSTAGEVIPGENPFTLCKGGEDTTDLASIAKIDLVPYPPKRGNDLTISASGTLREAVLDGATVEVQVKAFGINVYQKTLDACDILGKLGRRCPLGAGDVSFNYTLPIPKKGVPAGHYHLTGQALSADKRPISCIDGTIKLK